MKKVQIVVPAAVIAAASQAVMTMHSDNASVTLEPKDSVFEKVATSAVATARSQEIIRQAQPQIISVFRLDKQLLDEGYAEVAQETSHLRDSTMPGQVFSCYSNCHSACHGSRGWR